MRIEVSDAARRDIVAAFLFLRERNPKAAQSIRSAVRRAVLSLKRFPNRGRLGQKREFRELVVGRTPYIVVYAVIDDVVFVTRIRHTSQDPAPD